ncbi:MAG: helix-turn-helix domain-containing protein [Bacteroidota bacterium]
MANAILGVYLLLFALNISYNTLYWSELLYSQQFIHFFGWLLLLWLSYPPLIYLYTRRVVVRKGFSLTDLVHLIPMIFAILFYIPFFTLDAVTKLEVIGSGRLSEYVFGIKYHFVGVISVLIFYSILTYTSFLNKNLGYNKNRWLKWMIGAFLCYVIAMISYFVLSRLGLIGTGHDYFITYTIIFFIGMVSYFGFVQPDVFEGLSMDSVLRFKKYKNSGLTPGHSQESRLSLVEFMESEKPYLKGDLRLDDLAGKLNLSRHHMSQIINEHFDMTFFDFINSYRIDEAKKLLRDDPNLNITDVIYSSGFNNRMSFYNTFKKHTGITPTQFKSKQRG